MLLVHIFTIKRFNLPVAKKSHSFEYNQTNLKLHCVLTKNIFLLRFVAKLNLENEHIKDQRAMNFGYNGRPMEKHVE